MNRDQWKELLYQALETETGGIRVYESALECVVNPELKEEWEEYLEQTRNHEQILQEVFGKLGLDPNVETPGRKVVRHMGESLVGAMQMAKQSGKAAEAELVAAECVVLAETKDHADWELLGKCAEHLGGAEAEALQAAYDEIEDQEDEHLYHSRGWMRELELQMLGLKAVLPPPEERKHVKTAISAARAEQQRGKMR